MTGYTVHTGSSESFSSGWDRIFGGADKSRKAPKKAASQATTDAATAKPKKAATKPAGGKKPTTGT